MTHKMLVFYLEKELRRDDLSLETRKRLANRLKMQKPRHPQAADVSRRHAHYDATEWQAMRRRRKQAHAARRRNRR